MKEALQLLRAVESLEKQLGDQNPALRLRALWAARALGQISWDRVEKSLHDKDPYVRGWAIQLAMEQPEKEYVRINQLVKLAEKDDSPVVRRYLASALQRLDYEDRERILQHLLRNDDSKDPNLPLMYWYGLEPLAGNVDHRADALRLAANSPMAMILAFTVRRIAADATPESLDLVLSYVGEKDVNAAIILRELRNALKGRPQVAMPKSWPTAFAKLAASKDAEVRKQAVALAVTFGDARAFNEMRRVIATATADDATRQAALAALLAAKDKQLAPVLHKLLGDPPMRGAALRGLANYDDPRTPKAILDIYSKLGAAEKRDALSTLASRSTYAFIMLAAVGQKKIPAADVSADIVRSLRNLKDAAIAKKINEVWGVVRDTPLERVADIMRYHASS